MITLNDSSAVRQMKALLDIQVKAERTMQALAEDFGWTLRYAWQIKPGDDVKFDGGEGPVERIEDGPLGRVVHLDGYSKHLHPEDLVTVRVPPAPEPF